ncbi:diacylglyceryl transferase [Streptococcus sp. HMSC065C01]|jgi:prolipoprotein diacylglyceryl transferase|nr:diacylglyceryl transferase [Streptococcus sp. HMSC065C01]OFQ89597.1 diacylglyceryl transferase [Streptococcus sp. HMSC061E03]
MLLFMYMIYVIYFISKLKKEDKRVSLFTKIVVYGLLVLSLIKIYFGIVAFIFSPLPLIGSIVSLALGGMRLVLKIVIALSLLLLSLSLFLDSKKNDPDTPLIEHWLRLGYHILLMLL